MRIVRSAEYGRKPWKNGGGETTEIAVSPQGAPLDGFDWRVSMARIAADGPFSRFPGIDRTLLILDGRGIVLAIEGRAAVDLTTASEPMNFPGEIPAAARLIGGAVTDLNVMTRRGRLTHQVTRLHLSAPVERAIEADVGLLLCHAGSVEVATPDGAARLGRLDSLLVEGQPRGRWRIAADRPSLLVLVEITNA